MRIIFILARHTLKELIRKKDFYVFIILFISLSVFLYNETFFGVEGISRYLKEIGFSLIMLFSMIIAVTFSAKQIPSELDSKTVYPLLAKPVSRTELILGKFAGSVLISFITFTVFFALYLGFIFSKGEGAGYALMAQSYLFSMLLLVLLSSISVFFSQILTVSANVTIVFILYFSIYWYNGVLRDLLTSQTQKFAYLYGILYYILPHFEFYDTRIRLVHLWDPMPLWVVTAVTVYTVIYAGLVIWGACGIFRRKNL